MRSSALSARLTRSLTLGLMLGLTLSLCSGGGAITLLSSALSAQPRSKAHDEVHDEAHEHGQVEGEGLIEEPSGVRARLNEIDRRVLVMIKQREQTQGALSELVSALEASRERLAKRRSELTQERSTLSRALLLRRRLKGSRVAELLLSAEGPLELKRRELSLKAILGAGLKGLIALSEAEAELQREAQALAQQEESARALRDQLSTELSQLLSLRAEEAQLLNPSAELEGLREGASRLPPPTLGLWEDRFQSYRGRALAKLYGHGVRILGSARAPIYAVEEGEVIFVGWLRGRGETVIIAHPSLLGVKRVKSVYMGLEPRVHLGQRVQRQEMIGALSSEAGLSFELRRGLQPLYPRRFIEEVPLGEALRLKLRGADER